MQKLGLVLIATLVLPLVSCLEAPNTKVPEFTPPEIKVDFDGVLSSFKVCDVKESELPQVSDDVLADRLVVVDEIDSQDYESTSCDGTVYKGHGPVKDLSQEIFLSVPAELADKAPAKVAIKNARTCDSQDYYLIDTKGIAVGISDMKYKLGPQLKVNDGANILTVSWLQEDKTVLATETVYVDVKVHRPEISGVRKIPATGCDKK